MKKKIAGILIDTEANTAKAVTIDNTLEAYYSALNCSCIDIVERTMLWICITMERRSENFSSLTYGGKQCPRQANK